MSKTEKLLQIAKVIEEAMKMRGLNRSELAYVMNTQPSCITKWLSGKHNFTIETLFEIEKKLEVTLIKTCEVKSSFTKYIYVEDPNHRGFSSCA